MFSSMNNSITSLNTAIGYVKTFNRRISFEYRIKSSKVDKIEIY